MEGTPYIMRRRLLLGPGQVAVHAAAVRRARRHQPANGRKLWDVPLGTPPMPPGAPAPPMNLGMPNLGGPIITAGRLVFIAATLDRTFRAFDLDSGKELWKTRAPRRRPRDADDL